jgi:hypothetical protein
MIVRQSAKDRGTDTEYRMAMSAVDVDTLDAVLKLAQEIIEEGGTLAMDPEAGKVYALLTVIRAKLGSPERVT